MNSNKDYVSTLIYKCININENELKFNLNSIFTENVKFNKTIETSTKNIFNSSKLDILNKKQNDNIENNKVVVYGNNGQIKTNELFLKKINIGGNSITLPDKKANIGQFLSIDVNGNFIWTEPNHAGVDSLNGLFDVTVENSEITFGTKDIISWTPLTSHKVDLGSVNKRFKDLYVRRIITNSDNITSFIGRASVGYCGTHDFATFSHCDSNDSKSFSLGQKYDGTTILNSRINKSIFFNINNKNKIELNSNGQLLVGTNQETSRVNICGFTDKFKSKYNLFSNEIFSSSLSLDGNMIINDSILYQNDIRNKTNIKYLQSNESLEIIKNIKPIQYKNITNNINEIGLEFNQDSKLKKFKVSNFIPNIFEMCKFERLGENNILVLDKKTTNELNESKPIKVIKSDGTNIIVKILSFIDSKRIIIDSNLFGDTDYLYNKDKQIIKNFDYTLWNNNIFVFGQEVDDFTLFKESDILTLNTSAIQELNKKLEESNHKINILENQNKLFESRIKTLEMVLKSQDRLLKKK